MRTTVDAELRAILAAVRAVGPATRDELGAAIQQRGGTYSARAVAGAIRRGLIRPHFDPTKPGVDADLEWRIPTDEAYVLTLDGAIALGLKADLPE